ncbi:centrosomal protein of 170 kDa protein B isoform X2 [Xyrichtys novacula]|uniref:Centrosomal protein of 170 kDa protein B isoform X2 n=1 Tax=Xyrichtys novacula TaxID=13765 RepID=A0AAV1GID1_XYRNO|nr:centrosomal protein of 170 kDa protein B isoform X2 [Xyrichtys novacula]
MSVTSWFLVSSSGTRHRLPREMIFVGRDDCELMLQSRSVDKQHAVINYDSNRDEHMVKDLGSLNGTFVNDLRIPDQTYITLKLSDVIRFGYDAHVYILERSQHKVPEEALKHEKYTSQLQLGIKALEAKVKEKQQSSEKSKGSVTNAKQQDRAERKAQSLTGVADSPISKPTPLYGQPSWWGEDEDPTNKEKNRGGKSPEHGSPEHAKDMSRYEVNGSLSDTQAKSILSYRREPSYFEIPTKELQQRPNKVHEVPTKDTPDPTYCVPSTPTPPVVQSHASFTIEFDECTPGKMKIKDHVTKFSFRQPPNLPPPEAVTTPTEVMSAESKVADWLVQSNASMMRRRSQAEDMYSSNSDPLLHGTRAAKSDHDTHSDSGDPAVNGTDFLQSELQTGSQVSPQPLRASLQHYGTSDPKDLSSSSPPEFQSLPVQGKAEPHQAFVIEFFDDNPRKKRSQSFTNNIAPPEPSALRVQLEKGRKNPSPTGERRGQPRIPNTPPTQKYTVPLKGPASSGPQRAGSLRREKTEDRISTSFSSRSSSSVSVRPFGSAGRRSKISQDFTAELLKQTKAYSSATWEKNVSNPPAVAKKETAKTEPVLSQSSPPASYQPQTSSPIRQPVPLKPPVMPPASQSLEVKSPLNSPRHEDDDCLSDAGTYTIEADAQDREIEEARKKISQGQPAGGVLQGTPKWMSCWASLADSYTESGPSSGLFDIPSQMELSGGARGSIVHKATFARQHNSSTDSERARRILPPAPQGGKTDMPTPSIHVHYDPHSTFDVEEDGTVVPRSQDGLLRLSVQDDVEPDSLSDASRSDDGSIVEQRRRPLSDSEKKTSEDKPRLPAKSTSFYIGSREVVSKPEHLGTRSSASRAEKKVTKTFSTATMTKTKSNQDSGKIKPVMSAPFLDQERQSPESKERTVSPLIRQESFTKERPSNARLPNISSKPVQRDPEPESFQGESNQDTHSFLKETEDVLAVLEAKLQSGQSEKTPSPIPDSFSGESDVDTSSTISQQSNKTRPNTLTKKPSITGLHRETSSASLASQDSSQQSTPLNKRRTQGSDINNKTESVRRPIGLRRSVGKRGSTDLSDDPQSLPYSDQESYNHQTRKKYTIPLQKEDGKTSRVSQSLARANSLSAPRPTRASMLRRARLGDMSDNEGTETDRLCQEAVNAQSKQPQETKKLSRLDMLAMPRRRTSSFNTPSDTEGLSRTPSQGQKAVERPQKAALNKTPITRGRSSSAKYASSTASSRRRQKGSDYASTSDEEYDSNQSTPKHKRSQPSPAPNTMRNQPRPQPVVALRPKPRLRDSEDENQEGDTFHSWSNHSAEIARLSQDLAKDLAILAREIHDVAGEGDPQNPGVESSTPSSKVTAHEQLVHRIPEAGLNHCRVPPGSSSSKEPDQSSVDQNSKERKDELLVDNLMLNPVSQVILAIKENTEQLADKIKVLFQDRMDIWQDIEAKVNSDNEVPVVKTSNKEITSILKELRRVQRQLEVINTVMEPSEQPEASRNSASALSSRALSSRDWRAAHSAPKRGGGSRPGDSMRRAFVTSDDIRQGYLV